MQRFIFGAVLAGLAACSPALWQDAFVPPALNLRIEGIPPIHVSLATRIALYTEFRPKGFVSTR